MRLHATPRLLPLLLTPLLQPHRARPPQSCTDGFGIPGQRNTLSDDFQAELKSRGLQSALDELEADGPSAFKSPTKVVEYVMLCLQHRDDGIAQAARFTMPPLSDRSSTTGVRLGGRQLSWRTGKCIEGSPTGPALDAPAFEAELNEHYALLLGCAAWSFVDVQSPQVPGNEHKSPGSKDRGVLNNQDWEADVRLDVDGRGVVFSLAYDWGTWCYCVFRVTILPELAASDDADDAPRYRGL